MLHQLMLHTSCQLCDVSTSNHIKTLVGVIASMTQTLMQEITRQWQLTDFAPGVQFAATACTDNLV